MKMFQVIVSFMPQDHRVTVTKCTPEIVVFLSSMIIQLVLAREAKRTTGARVDGAIKAGYIRMCRLNMAIKIMSCPKRLVVRMPIYESL